MYQKWAAYGQAKAANMLFAISLAKKLGQSKGLVAFSLHPGVIMTKLRRHIEETDFAGLGEFMPQLTVQWR
jgi:NAD(P)-dependent dehydrogenase (short-subunit alcohol dehydrogenase family)